jgi:hypothetical protein
VLFLHDVHAAIGEREIELDEMVRDVYAPRVADDGGRLLWYLYSTHGAGDAYFVVMITALQDGAAWERLSRRLRYGDLADWQVAVDALTYSSQSTLMAPTDWSPTAGLDLESVATEPTQHDVRVFREDSLVGARIEEAVVPPSRAAGNLLECVAGLRPLLSPDGPVHVLYRLASQEALESALATESGWDDWSGSLTTALPAGGHRSSRLLRNVPWSPLA